MSIVLLEEFDADVENVLDELDALISDPTQKARLREVQRAVGDYDYDSALDLLNRWASEMGMVERG